MDPQRAELIARFYEAFSRRDVNGMLALCDEDVEIYKDPGVIEMVSALTPRGREGVERYLTGWLDSWDLYEPRVAELREAGPDEVVVLVDLHARGRGSQFDLNEEIADVLSFHGERLAQLRLHVTRDVALRDAGLES
jgi:ketosteroid isomerase-like protein